MLMHHRIGRKGDPFPHLDVGEFRRQLEWLARHCEVIGPEQLRDAAQAPPRRRTPVLLTFDDGTRDYYDVAYPVLREFGMRAVVFIVTDHIDSSRLLWFDRLHLAVHAARREHVRLPWRPEVCLPLGGSRNTSVIEACKRHLKGVSDDIKVRDMEALVTALGNPRLPDVGRQMMSWDEVRRSMDLTIYGGHTHTHPLMSQVDDVRLEHEVRACRDRIVAETGTHPTLFAYPNGAFTPAAKAVVSRFGFDTAFSTIEGLANGNTDWLEVRRIGVGHVVPTVWMMKQSWT